MESTKKKKIACKTCLSWKFVDTQYRNDFGKECKLMEIEILNSCVSNRANILAHNWTIPILKNLQPSFLAIFTNLNNVELWEFPIIMQDKPKLSNFEVRSLKFLQIKEFQQNCTAETA